MDASFALHYERRTALNAPGKTPPRLINDLLDYDPRYPRRNGSNLLRGPAPQFEGVDMPRVGALDCHHKLMRKDAQTDAPRSNDVKFDGSEIWTVAAYCQDCRYHFTITANYHNSKAPCNLADPANPLHHLQLDGFESSQDYVERNGNNKYDIVTEFHRLKCSGDECGLVVTIKISPPKLDSNLMEPVLNRQKMQTRGQKEIEAIPERYGPMTAFNPLQGLIYIRTYLVNARNQSETWKDENKVKPIPKRNKTFVLAFGDECDRIFEYLGFKSFKEIVPDTSETASHNYLWRPPYFNETNTSWYEDVLVELELYMISRPPLEYQPGAGRIACQPVPALKDIERSLGYYDYPTRSRTVDLERIEHPYYASLGVVDNFTDDLLSWAYDRQCECDPRNKPYYLDCLEDLAKGRKSSDLELKVVMAQSAGQYGLKAIHDAYGLFGLDPSTMEGDDHIMGVYRSRIESAPRQKEEARNCLLIIAKTRSSSKIEALANDNAMTLNEALEFLNVSKDTTSDSIEASAVAVSLDSDSGKVARALRAIAKDRNGDYVLLAAASSMDGTGLPSLEIGEAYDRLQIPSQAAPDDTVLAYYTSLSSGAASGSMESYKVALETIARQRQSAFLLAKLNDPNAKLDVIPLNKDQPIGLNNIGNTCYLNSLLQYYYTIKPVRHVVINFEDYRMELTEENLKSKKAGGRGVTRAEVIKAQSFMDEMHSLFENLKTASARSVKPTKDLAELSIFSEKAEAQIQIRRQSIASPQGPPSIDSIMNGQTGPSYGPELPPPPVPSRPSPHPILEDTEMIENPEQRNTESSSGTESDDTLVDEIDLPRRNSRLNGATDKDQKINEAVEEDADAVMVNGLQDDEGTENDQPPPVPPRKNKHNLSVSTNEIPKNDNKDLIPNDDRWRFGTQQDVDEVIRNIIFRMQCAMKPTSIDEVSGDQNNLIDDTFYGKHARYTLKADKIDRRVETWSSILVYASKHGPSNLYGALDVVHDVQNVEVGSTPTPQYTSIDRLPPVVQIQISRTDWDDERKMSYKIQHPVTFPETLYLDRYMDSEEDSVLAHRRRQAWEWKSTLRRLEARQSALKNQGAELNVADALMATKDFAGVLQEEEIDGIEIAAGLSESLDERAAEVAAEMEAISKEITDLKQILSEQFTDMREFEYKLHAVFIHRGEAGSGHYWIYIYDYDNDLWREYNDESVTILSDRKRVFDQTVGGGTPYCLVYVRGSDRANFVDPVCRDVQEVQQIEVAPARVAEDEDEGIAMIDVSSEEGDSRHVEHAKPRPLRPKPAAFKNPVETWDTEDWDNKATGLDANGEKW